MKITVIDADILTKLSLEKIFSKIDKLSYLFIEENERVTNFKDLEHDAPQIIMVNLQKRNFSSVNTLSDLTQTYSDAQIIILTDSSYQRILADLSEVDSFEIVSKPISKKEILTLITKYRKKTPLENIYINMLRKIVLKKDFLEMYHQIETMQEKISQQWMKEKEHLIDQLNQMVNVGLELINCTNQSQKNFYKEKLSFTPQILKDKFHVQFKLYELFHLIYQQRGIQKRPQLIQLFEYVDKHLYREMTLAEAADYCQISQSYLSRILKENYSIGFNTYVQIEKVFLAKKNFYYNDDKIIDVSFQLSYSEPSYFCKVFKRIEGKTPSNVKDEMEEIRNLVTN